MSLAKNIVEASDAIPKGVVSIANSVVVAASPFARYETRKDDDIDSGVVAQLTPQAVAAIKIAGDAATLKFTDKRVMLNTTFGTSRHNLSVIDLPTYQPIECNKEIAVPIGALARLAAPASYVMDNDLVSFAFKRGVTLCGVNGKLVAVGTSGAALRCVELGNCDEPFATVLRRDVAKMIAKNFAEATTIGFNDDGGFSISCPTARFQSATLETVGIALSLKPILQNGVINQANCSVDANEARLLMQALETAAIDAEIVTVSVGNNAITVTVEGSLMGVNASIPCAEHRAASTTSDPGLLLEACRQTLTQGGVIKITDRFISTAPSVGLFDFALVGSKTEAKNA
jgi:hypothetical protein